MQQLRSSVQHQNQRLGVHATSHVWQVQRRRAIPYCRPASRQRWRPLWNHKRGGENGAGTVFKMDTNGNNYLVIYSFKPGSEDGQNPFCGVVQGSDEMLYGTCYSGGLWSSGIVFKLNTNGGDYTIIHNFDPNSGEGKYPEGALVQDANGTLYGTTFWDGGSGKGVIFRVNSDGSGYTVIHNFASVTNDGANPTAQLIQGSDGTLYGTCEQGGTNSRGTIFKVNTDGAGYAVLHNFTTTGGDGQSPYAALMLGTKRSALRDDDIRGQQWPRNDFQDRHEWHELRSAAQLRQRCRWSISILPIPAPGTRRGNLRCKCCWWNDRFCRSRGNRRLIQAQ